MSNVVVRSLVEFFTLKEAAAQAARLDEAGRKRVLERAGLAKQRADAAESLWAAGHPAEALRLVVDALGKTRDASEAWLEATGQGAPPALVQPVGTMGGDDAKTDAKPSEADAKPSEDEARPSEAEAKPSEAEAKPSEAEAKPSEAEAMPSEDAAKSSEDAAKPSEAEAKPSEDAAKPSEVVAKHADAKPSPTSASSVISRFLAARGVGAAALGRVTALEAELASTALPLLDAEVQPVHGDLFDRLTDLRTTVARSLGEVTLVPRELTFRRIGRISTVVVLGLLSVVGSYLALRTPEGVHARASAHFNELPDFEPSRVLDGNTDTSWLLPDRTAGWVEVTINPARNVSRIRVLNTHNTPYNDRATLQYRIIVFAHGAEARSIDGEFEFSASPAWVTHDLGAIDGVDRVRFEVRSWHQHGGGLAEMQIE